MGIDQLSLQDGVQINGMGFTPMHQTVWAMLLGKAEKAGAIDHDGEATLETGVIEHFVADQPTHAVRAQLTNGSGPDMAQVMAQSLVNRQGGLLGVSQAIDVLEDPELEVPQFEVQLTAAAQFATEQ